MTSLTQLPSSQTLIRAVTISQQARSRPLSRGRWFERSTWAITLKEFSPDRQDRDGRADHCGDTTGEARERRESVRERHVARVERRPREIAEWSSTLGDYRYAVVGALRQALDAAVRWGYCEQNAAKLAGPNPQPKAREIAPFTLAEVDALAVELGPVFGPLVLFAAETGLRPEEWIALERSDVLRDATAVLVERVVTDGRLRPYGKTARSRRRVPLTPRAFLAVDEVPARLDSRLLFPAAKGGYIGLDSWRSREWYPALEAAGLAQRGPYALRHTFITHALSAGVPIFDVARYAGTSVQMIERTYGHLAKGSERHARELLAAYATDHLGQERATTTDEP